MKKLLISLILLLNLNTMNAIKIKLPNAKELFNRIKAVPGVPANHFIEKTDIMKHLADQELTVTDVTLFVIFMVDDYNNYHKNPIVGSIMLQSIPFITKSILKDSKEAIEEYENILKKAQDAAAEKIANSPNDYE